VGFAEGDLSDCVRGGDEWCFRVLREKVGEVSVDADEFVCEQVECGEFAVDVVAWDGTSLSWLLPLDHNNASIG